MVSIYEWPDFLNEEDFKEMIQDRLPGNFDIEVVGIDEEVRGFYVIVAFYFKKMAEESPPDVFYTHFYISDMNNYLAG